jgi:hypothetical protein
LRDTDLLKDRHRESLRCISDHPEKPVVGNFLTATSGISDILRQAAGGWSIAAPLSGTPAFRLRGGLRTSLAKKFTKRVHQIAAIRRSRATIGYCVEIKTRVCFRAHRVFPVCCLVSAVSL